MASIDKMASVSRVVLIFGETFQDFGVVAHRVIGGPGGVDKGSMVSFVRAFLDEGQGRVGVILANMGQLLWWAEGDPPRPLTRSALAGAPMRSAVHDFPSGAAIPNHGSTSEHVRAIFEEVVPALVPTTAALDIVAVGDAADVVEAYLDHEDVWGRLRSRLGCFANVGGYFPVWELKCDGFKQFLRNVSFLCQDPILCPLSFYATIYHIHHCGAISRLKYNNYTFHLKTIRDKTRLTKDILAGSRLYTLY